MASGRKSRTAMDVFKSDLDYLSTYSRKIDEMLSKTTAERVRIRSIFEFRRRNSNRRDDRTVRKSGQRQIESLVRCFSPFVTERRPFGRFSTQLCVAVQMKCAVSSGRTGAAIYIDTEGSFVPIRLQNMTIAAETHYRNEGLILSEPPSAEQILRNVTFFRCVNIAELMACLLQLRSLMQSEGNVRLIVLDSLAHPIRSLVDGDHLTRHKQTIRIVNILQKLASEFDCAVRRRIAFFIKLFLLRQVVVVNHMVAKIDAIKNEAYCAPGKRV